MKKLKKLNLNEEKKVLSSKEMKSITGGFGCSTCDGLGQSQCSGSCTGSDGATGTCTWVSVWSSCKCATVSAGFYMW